MLVYIAIFSMILLIYLFERLTYAKAPRTGSTEYKSNIKFDTFLFFLILAVLFFVSVFRADNIGSNNENYIKAFHDIEITGDAYFREKGFVLMNKIIIFFGGGTIWMNVAVTGMLTVCFAIYIKRFVRSDFYILAVLIFTFQPYLYLQSTFNIIRQGCAAGILMIAVLFLAERKPIRFVLFTILASTFHAHAMIMLALIAIRYVKITPKMIRVIATAMLISNLLNLSNLVFRFIGDYTKYEGYTETMLNFKPYVIAIYIIIMYLTTLYEKLYKDPKEKFFVDLFLIGLSLMIFFVQNDAFYRVYIDIAFLSIPGVTAICKNMRGSRVSFELLFGGYYSAFFAGYILFLYYKKNTAYVPFRFIFG